MALSFAFDIYPGGRIYSACSGNGNLLLATAVGSDNLYSYSLTTGQLNWTGSHAAEYDAMCFINAASSICLSGGSTTAYVVEQVAGYMQAYTGGAVVPNTGKGQQCDNNGNNIVFGCTGTNNKISSFNGNTFTLSLVTPSSGFTTTQALTIIGKSDSQNFLVGTNKGTICELDSSGNNYLTVTLPTTNNTGTAPVLQVSGLAYYNGNVLAMTNYGIAYHYKWSTQALLGMYLWGATDEGTTTGTSLCNGACGVTVFSQNLARSTSTLPTCQVDFNYSPTIVVNTFQNEFTGYCVGTGIDTSTYTAWAALGGTASERARVYTITNLGQTSEIARIQVSGVDTAGRIIRIKDFGPGKSRVEVDTNISAGVNTLEAGSMANYLEVATVGTPNSNETADLRIFQT